MAVAAISENFVHTVQASTAHPFGIAPAYPLASFVITVTLPSRAARFGLEIPFQMFIT